MLAVAFRGSQLHGVPSGLFGGSLTSAGLDGWDSVMIQAVKFLTACSRLGAVSGWEVLRVSVHWLSDTLRQLR